LVNAYHGKSNIARGKYVQARNNLENATILNSILGLGFLIRGKLFMVLGLEESTKELFDNSAGLDLQAT
jgi:hypothetical protein